MKELTVAAELDNAQVVADFVELQLEEMDCPPKARAHIGIAVDELYTNIASYAYGESEGTATIQFETLREPKAAVITFIDSGRPFDPLAAKDPDISLPRSHRRIGGLGVLMVKKTMDEIEYKYQDGKNILKIKKNF